MSRRSDGRVTGLVLAAGGSTRLGRPKQLLAYGGGTLLDHTLATARACDFDQLICVIEAPPTRFARRSTSPAPTCSRTVSSGPAARRRSRWRSTPSTPAAPP